MGVKCSTILWDMDEAKRVCEEQVTNMSFLFKSKYLSLSNVHRNQEAFPHADKALRYTLFQHFGKVQVSYHYPVCPLCVFLYYLFTNQIQDYTFTTK